MEKKFHSLLEKNGLKVELEAIGNNFTLTLPSKITCENEAFLVVNYLDSILENYMEATGGLNIEIDDLCVDDNNCDEHENCLNCPEFDITRPCYVK